MLPSSKRIEVRHSKVRAHPTMFPAGLGTVSCDFQGVPGNSQEFIKIYEAEIAPSPLPVEDSAMSLLRTSLKTDRRAEYRFIEI
jgi:hypothetical protein